MTSIPASEIVQVNPGVLSAGGTALQTLGLCLDNNPRIPIGAILSFPNAASVTTYFGGGSLEQTLAEGGPNAGGGYFAGFLNREMSPAQMLFAQYNSSDVAAWLRGGPAKVLTIPQLQAITGDLNVTVDGFKYDWPTVNLSGATSFSAAAALIQSGLNTTPPPAASFTGAVASSTVNFTGYIAGNVLYVTTAPTTGAVTVGGQITLGAAAGTTIDGQLSGTPGGIGSYAISGAPQNVPEGTAMTETYGTLTVSAITTGTLSIGQTLKGGSTAANTQIMGLGTGSGLTGTYIVNIGQTVVSGALTTVGSPLTVTFDSISGGFVISATDRGAQSTITYAAGSAAALLYLTQATGAIQSQGANAASAQTFMDALAASMSDWVSFFTSYDPDGGQGNQQKQAFAAWVNSSNFRFMYICIDSDPTPTETPNAASSLGQILQTENSSGTFLMYEPAAVGQTAYDPFNYAAFVAGMTASINYNATNGRITFAFKGQTGLIATVTDAGTADNLIANGYNFYADYATAAQQFLWLYPGQIAGPFQWADSYVDQIVLNAAFQLALMELLGIVNSIPYNQEGYSWIEGAMADPIAMALNSGIIRIGIELSNEQTIAINEEAGGNVAPVITAQGWVTVIQPASPQVRQARGSPVIIFWYADGQSIQKIVLNSILVQ